jgi:hypothetical protein
VVFLIAPETLLFLEKDGINMDNSFSYFGVPAGFGMALAANHRALGGYSQMSEAEKEEIIMRCKDARSDEEIDEIIDSIGWDEMTGSGDIMDEIS